MDSSIAAIVADPESTHAWDMYSDWLLDRGDPRGEWIRAALASDDDKVATNRPVDEERLLSPRLAEHSHVLDFRWWRGFIRGARLMGAMDDPPTFETIDALFADPHAALLSQLSLVHPINETVPLWQAAFAEARPSITSFTATNLGTAPLDALPNLASLDLAGFRDALSLDMATTAPVEQLAHPGLRKLVANGTACPAAVSGRVELPNLERLEWVLFEMIARQFCIRPAASMALFTSPESLLRRPPPKLRELNVMFDTGSRHETFAMLVPCAGLGQLRRVSWHGIDFKCASAELIEHATAFQHLDALAMSGMSSLPATDVDDLRARLEHALPTTKLEIDWDRLIKRPSGPSQPAPVIDADSRDEHGRIRAIARFTQHRGTDV
jgi:uncharacterized protein (TIGR02996 family)